MHKEMIMVAIMVAFSFIQTGFSQCENGEVSATLEIFTDYYAYETSWAILTPQGDTLHSSVGTTLQDTTLHVNNFCFGGDQCLQFVIADSYGDGFTSNGWARLAVEEVEILYVDDFEFDVKKYFNCQPGYSCDDAIEITDTDFVLDIAEKWYHFTPSEIGQYEITT